MEKGVLLNSQTLLVFVEKRGKIGMKILEKGVYFKFQDYPVSSLSTVSAGTEFLF